MLRADYIVCTYSPCSSGYQLIIYFVGMWKTVISQSSCRSPDSTSLASLQGEETHKFKRLQEDLTELSLKLHEKKLLRVISYSKRTFCIIKFHHTGSFAPSHLCFQILLQFQPRWGKGSWEGNCWAIDQKGDICRDENSSSFLPTLVRCF